MDGFATVTRLGGYIILFSVLGQLAQALRLPPAVSAFLGAVLEISSGIDMICGLQGIPQVWKTALCCACASFGGCCICAQTQSVLAGSPLRTGDWLKGRVIMLLPVLLSALLYPPAAQALRGCR